MGRAACRFVCPLSLSLLLFRPSSFLVPCPLFLFLFLTLFFWRIRAILVMRSSDISRLQSFKRDSADDPQRGDTKRVEIVTRPSPSERVQVLEGELVSPPPHYTTKE